MVCITLNLPFVNGGKVALVEGRFIRVQRLVSLLQLKSEQELLRMRDDDTRSLICQPVMCPLGKRRKDERHMCIDVKKHMKLVLESIGWSESKVAEGVAQITNLRFPRQPKADGGKKAAKDADSGPGEEEDSGSGEEEEEEEEEESSRSRKRDRERDRERERDGTDSLESIIKRLDTAVERTLQLMGDKAVAVAIALPEFEKRVQAEAESRIKEREKAAMREVTRKCAERERAAMRELDKKLEEREARSAAVSSKLTLNAQPAGMFDDIFTRLSK